MTSHTENETSMLLIGRRRGQGFTIGEHTHILVTAVDPDSATLKLRRVGEGERSLDITAGGQLEVTNDITVHVHELDRTWARLAIDAPKDVLVIRDEIRPGRGGVTTLTTFV